MLLTFFCIYVANFDKNYTFLTFNARQNVVCVSCCSRVYQSDGEEENVIWNQGVVAPKHICLRCWNHKKK